jgi:hypothetical protein
MLYQPGLAFKICVRIAIRFKNYGRIDAADIFYFILYKYSTIAYFQIKT